jgi:phage terminase large subunit-like protein
MAETTFKWTIKQMVALAILASVSMHIMLFGGSRSGKTFLLIRCIILRALKAPESRHLVLRLHLVDIRQSVVMDTFPKVMRLCFPDIAYDLNKSDLFAKMPNGSEIWFGGLDDKERVDKILGKEYVTIYFNEVSQIPYASIETALTRLAQKVMQDKIDDRPERLLPLKAYYDCNPPPKTHWCYRIFIQKVDPVSKQALNDPERYDSLLMNPRDNLDNLATEYVKGVLEQMTGAKRNRFLDGKFQDAIPNALWTEEIIDKCRVMPGGRIPNFKRIVAAIDPSGAGDEDNAENAAIGIIVSGLGYDNRGYVLEDLTLTAGPATWGRVAADAYDKWEADAIIGEKNFGGAMVKFVIQTAKPNVKYIDVTASRGKHVRAEPISSLYENDRVRHVGFFPELEEELCAMSSSGYLGPASPNRADALVWSLTELFPELAGTKKKIQRLAA